VHKRGEELRNSLEAVREKEVAPAWNQTPILWACSLAAAPVKLS